MKNLLLKFSFFSFLIACLLSSCIDDETYKNTNEVKEEREYFSFSTTQDVKVDIDLGFDGFVSLVKFYAVDPYILNEDSLYVIDSSLLPLYEAYTNSQNKLQITMQISAAYSKLYVASDPLILSTALLLQIDNGVLNYDYKNPPDQISNTKNQKTFRTYNDYIDYKLITYQDDYYYVDSILNFHSLFDTYDSWSEEYNTKYYVYNSKHPLYTVLPNDAMISENSTLGEMMSRVDEKITNDEFIDPVQLSSETADFLNLKVLSTVDGKDSEGVTIDLTSFFTYASFNDALCYYYYDSNSVPITQEEMLKLPKYVVEPRICQNGMNLKVSIRLKYFGIEGDEVGTDTFPPGITVGWLLVANHTWSVSDADGIKKILYGIGDKYKNNDHYSYSNSEANQYGTACMGIYDAISKSLVIGFEDTNYRIDDRNTTFDDVIFCVKAIPSNGVYINDKLPTTSDITSEKWTVTTSEGLLAFEDIWPSGGDYDLNDVVVDYRKEITMNQDNDIKKIVYTFKPIFDGAYQNNAFGLVINDGIDIGTIDESNSNYSIKEANGQYIIYPSNRSAVIACKADSTLTYTLTRTFTKGSYPNLENYRENDNPFIVPKYVEGEANRIEVHLPKHPATSWADQSFINISSNAYFINSSGEYPYAIKLDGVSEMINYDESISISDKYPNYDKWVQSRGTAYNNWYLFDN